MQIQVRVHFLYRIIVLHFVQWLSNHWVINNLVSANIYIDK